MDSLEQELRRRLITVRELRPEAIVEADRALYEYQLKIGSPAVYFTYERLCSNI